MEKFKLKKNICCDHDEQNLHAVFHETRNSPSYKFEQLKANIKILQIVFKSSLKSIFIQTVDQWSFFSEPRPKKQKQHQQGLLTNSIKICVSGKTATSKRPLNNDTNRIAID